MRVYLLQVKHAFCLMFMPTLVSTTALWGLDFTDYSCDVFGIKAIGIGVDI